MTDDIEWLDARLSMRRAGRAGGLFRWRTAAGFFRARPCARPFAAKPPIDPTNRPSDIVQFDLG
jgi:hypothetical protein